MQPLSAQRVGGSPAEGREVKRVCSAAGTAAGPCQLVYKLLRACREPTSSLAVALGTLLSLLFLVLFPWRKAQQQTCALGKQRVQDQHKVFYAEDFKVCSY